MKIKMICSVCGTEEISTYDYDSLEEFMQNPPEDEFEGHDPDCGGTLKYVEA
jgi:hypothetical protein